MAEREELAQIIADADCGRPNSSVINDDRTYADAILAAGYRRPRLVTTAEELVALPYGTIVRAVELRYKNREIGHVFEHVGRGEFLELDPGDRYDGENTMQSVAIVHLYKGGITVLWSPDE